MKNTVKALFASLVFSILTCSVVEAKLPATWAEFKQEYQTVATTPQGAAKMLFKGIFCWTKAVQTKNAQLKKDAGKMIRYAVYSDVPIETSIYYSTFRERLNDPDYYYIFRSFAAGTSVENSYQMDPENFELNIEKIRKSRDNYYYVDLISSGADSIRYVMAEKKPDGLWYITSPHNVYVMVRKPKSHEVQHMHDHDPDYD